VGGKCKTQLNLPKSRLPVSLCTGGHISLVHHGWQNVSWIGRGNGIVTTASDAEISLCISRRLWKIRPYCLQKTVYLVGGLADCKWKGTQAWCLPLDQSVSSLHTHYIIEAYYVWYTAFFDSMLSWWQCIAARPCADPAFKTTQPPWHDVRKKTSQTRTLLSYVNIIQARSKMTDQAAVVLEDSDRGH